VENRYLGLGAAPGIAIGPAVVWCPELPSVDKEPTTGSPEEERARLKAAVRAAETELAELKSRTERELGPEEAAIFTAHLLMLADPALVGRAAGLISQGESADTAMAQAVAEQAALLEALPDEYLAERAADVRDAGGRVLAHLRGQQQQLPQLDVPSIVVAPDLTPSQTARLPKERLLGLVTETGGRTSHVAIMARSLGIPAVVGTGGIVAQVKSGQVVALDGTSGEVVLHPEAAELAEWQQRQNQLRTDRCRRQALAAQPAITVDGQRVTLMANIGRPSEVQPALNMGAAGIGLFRTEFLYMDREQLPSEEEQLAAYRQVVELMAPQPVIIRTLDIGGDKDLPYLGLVREANPFLGWRALRYSLSHPEIFRTQLRAILRAAAAGEVRIMFPLVVSIQEIRQAKEQLAQAQRELDERKVPRGDKVQVGIMVETPAAAIIADQLAREADFFSIGSNDLIQYTLAADRQNERVAAVFDSFHPAVLRLIDTTIAAGREAGIEVGLCGEMAGDPLATPLLLGLGLQKFSMAALSLPAVKEKVRTWSLDAARSLARQALELSSGEEVQTLVLNWGDGA
jgi:phosphotransferase system enzyme I (PtsI)